MTTVDGIAIFISVNTDGISREVALALGSSVLRRFFRVSVGEASRILNLPRRKIHLFIEQGVVVPSEVAPGTGNRRRLGFKDVVMLKVAQRLNLLGIKPRDLRKIVNDVAHVTKPGRWAKLVAVFPGPTVVELDGAHDQEVAGLMRQALTPLLIPLDLISMEVSVALLREADRPEHEEEPGSGTTLTEATDDLVASFQTEAIQEATSLANKLILPTSADRQPTDPTATA